MSATMSPSHGDKSASTTPETPQDFIKDDIPEMLKDDCLIKYFRCRFDMREDLYNKLEDQSQKARVDRELTRVTELKASVDSTNGPLIELYKYHRAIWKNSAINESQESLLNIKTRVENMEKLTEEHLTRREQWEESILTKVKGWRQIPLPSKPTKIQEEKDAAAEPHSSGNCFKRAFHNLKKPAKAPGRGRNKPKRPPQTKAERTRPDDSYGISITEIILDKTKSTAECSDSYLNHTTKRYPLNDVLFDDQNSPLKRENHKPNTIRYFHLPANNMHWIEEAIARYYGEETPGEYNYRQDKKYRPNSSNILCREFWTSLQHGGIYDPVHARHMKAHCSLITPESPHGSQCHAGSKNFVIFMPYLHWETHKRRKKMAEITKEITKNHHENRSHVTENLKDELIKIADAIKIKHARALTGFRTAQESREAAEKEKPKKEGKRSPLGNYLLQIARVWEAMDIEPDVRILRDHLHQEPPLHGRRTLDQSYYWKLLNTDGRDEDQVVYRETKSGKSILRTSRVVMVDQLWLYILDDHTIITSFPRRWGRNKPDHSGVHKTIRGALAHLRPGQITTVYDLALLIMNQCSTVFFDRTKPVDERPEVLDIFSNALSHVSGMKTVAFETFWQHLDKLSASDRQLINFEATARSYLNINPEGELLKEAHDIIEELRMMTRIYSHQLEVMEDFSTNLQNLHQQEKKSLPDDRLQVLVDIKKLLADEIAARHNEAPQPPSPNHEHSQVAIIKGVTITNGPETMSGGDDNLKPEITIPDNTLELAKRVSDNMLLRKKELQDLESSTVTISEHLKDLLSLKQQQASIIEAKYALKRADESVSQGRSVMLFTIVTIIFLPLSFMSSVFGMNAKEFSSPNGGNSMSLKHQFWYMFPISTGVILLSVALAFSTWIRSTIYLLMNVFWAVLIEYTYIRRLWRFIIHKNTPDNLYLSEQRLVRKIYSRKEREVMRSEREEAKVKEELLEKRANGTPKVGGDGFENGSGNRQGDGQPGNRNSSRLSNFGRDKGTDRGDDEEGDEWGCFMGFPRKRGKTGGSNV